MVENILDENESSTSRRHQIVKHLDESAIISTIMLFELRHIFNLTPSGEYWQVLKFGYPYNMSIIRCAYIVDLLYRDTIYLRPVNVELCVRIRVTAYETKR